MTDSRMPIASTEADAALRVALSGLARRQQVIANNIANADTPGFKARDFDFRAALETALASAAPGASAGATSMAGKPELLYRQPLQPSLDGNTVEMDVERAQFADNAVRYEAEIAFINAHLRNLLAVLQG